LQHLLKYRSVLISEPTLPFGRHVSETPNWLDIWHLVPMLNVVSFFSQVLVESHGVSFVVSAHAIYPSSMNLQQSEIFDATHLQHNNTMTLEFTS
jgi:hypothetical protein